MKCRQPTTHPTLLALVLMLGLQALPGQAAPLLHSRIIDNRQINESSGLARSQRRAGLLWTHNDSGGEAVVYGVSTHGRHVATLALSGDEVGNIDWEDIASFRRDGQSFLLVGDMGDNIAWRSYLVFYLIREPALGATLPAQPRTLTAPVLARYQVSYPDGARDAEALAVDPRENMAYVISKRDARPTLYRFRLDAAHEPQVMEALGPIDIPRASADHRGSKADFNWVTAMDFDDTLSRAYVGTPTRGYFYDRRPGETWLQALSRPPFAFSLPDWPQIEAGSFQRHRRDRIHLSSEQLPAHLGLLRP